MPHGSARADALPEQISFPSADGKTLLVGYLFKPPSMPATQVPAVVMMHGRAGAYSSRANGIYNASTLSKRHLMWGRLWAQQGYIAVLVDGFGPRGYPQGFPRFSYKWRPAGVDEVSVRPLDAHGALAYLRSRADIAGDRIALQGWSNGASAALAAMFGDAPDTGAAAPARRFRGALAFYPACGLKGRFELGLSAVCASAGLPRHRRRGGIFCPLWRVRSQERRTGRRHRHPPLRRRHAWL